MQTEALLPGILIQERNENGLISLCVSSGPPSTTATAADTFAKGCILQDSTTGESYQNEGTSASPSFQAIQTSGGSGDVVGPGSSTDGGVALFDQTTGKLIKDSTFVFPAADGSAGDVLVTNGSKILSFAAPSTVGLVENITFVFDNSGAALATGIAGDLQINYACTIVGATLLADQTGSVVVNIWKNTYANYPPTVADKITASAPPTISAAIKSTDTTLTGWTTSIAAGDTLRFNIDSAATITRCTLILKVTRT
jgi:hypothetical protein